ncbi:MAG: hypothetical protein GY913_24960 [Proteobacteria bacterium]|nr:hypothetical protein [Pseudomonadota bacterium]MCP4920165.1 hypothetical protein [Pseudomonadota bacterium]
MRAVRELSVQVPPTAFMAVLTDFVSYPDFLPDMEGARVLSEQGDAWEVSFSLRLIRQLDYTLRLVRTVGDEGHQRLEWTMVQGVFRENRGSWTLAPTATGGTLALYELDVAVGMYVPRSILNSLLTTKLTATLDAFKLRAETTSPGFGGSGPADG